MANSFLAPLFDNNSTKSAVIEILSQNKPMTVKELYNEVSKGKQITYQALHKAVKEMLDTEVLEKIEKKVSISKRWVEKLGKFTAMLNTKDSWPGKIDTTTQTKIYMFENFVDLGKFIIRFFHDAPNPEKKPAICIMQHSWPVFGMGKTDYELLAEMFKETTFYDFVRFDTPLDILFAKMLEQIGKKVSVGVNINLPFDLVCKGDHICQIYFSQDFTKKFDEIFQKYKNIEQLQINELMQEFMVQKTKITVIHIVDKETAERVTADALSKT